MECLQNLPDRGTLRGVEGGYLYRVPAKPYTCEHSTAPPANQIVVTPSTNLLVNYLVKQKAAKEAQKKTEKGKRPAPSTAQPAEKRQNTGAEAGPSSSGGAVGARPRHRLHTLLDLNAMPVSRLTAVLKERGLAAKSRDKKEDIIRRILDAQNQELMEARRRQAAPTPERSQQATAAP